MRSFHSIQPFFVALTCAAALVSSPATARAVVTEIGPADNLSASVAALEPPGDG